MRRSSNLTSTYCNIHTTQPPLGNLGAIDWTQLSSINVYDTEKYRRQHPEKFSINGTTKPFSQKDEITEFATAYRQTGHL